MPEEFQVLVKKSDKIDTRSTGDVHLELRFADIIINLANLREEAINSTLGFLMIFLSPGHESLPRQSHEGLGLGSYRILRSLTPRLYLRPCRTPSTEPSAISPDSTHRSLKPASWKRLPIMDSRVQAVWNTPILNAISLNLSL